jgi:hypothetical protein
LTAERTTPTAQESTGKSGDTNSKGARTDGNTINRRDVNYGRGNSMDANKSRGINNIRDPGLLETHVGNETSTAVRTAATAKTLPKGGTPRTPTAAAGMQETAETMTTAGVQATPTAEITMGTAESTEKAPTTSPGSQQ